MERFHIQTELSLALTFSTVLEQRLYQLTSVASYSITVFLGENWSTRFATRWQYLRRWVVVVFANWLHYKLVDSIKSHRTKSNYCSLLLDLELSKYKNVPLGLEKLKKKNSTQLFHLIIFTYWEKNVQNFRTVLRNGTLILSEMKRN